MFGWLRGLAQLIFPHFRRVTLSVMEVVTDAMPSPARERVEPSGASGQPGPQDEHQPKEQDGGIPGSEQVNETKYGEGTQDSERKSSNRSSSARQEHPKTQKRRPSSSKRSNQIQNNIHIQGCRDVTFGSVTNHFYDFNAKSKDVMQMKDGVPRVPKELRKLQNSNKNVSDEDLIIVSESVDMDGLENLATELGIEPVELNRIKHNYKDKGLQEIAYQTLKLWCDVSSSGENQAAMLNILCDKVYKIYSNGGKEALKTLCKTHFCRIKRNN